MTNDSRIKYKTLFKNTGIFAISNFSSKILVFLLVPLYTRVLSIEEYGYYDLAYTTVQLCFPILTLGINEAVMIFLLKENGKQKKIFSIALRLIVFSDLIFLSGLLINYLCNISSITKEYSAFIFAFYVFYCFESVLFQFAKGINAVTDMAFASVIGTLAMVLFNILFLLVFKCGLKGYFIANILGYFIPCAYLTIKLELWKYIDRKIDKKLQHSIIVYAVPLIVNTLGWWVNNTSDRYIVSAICGVGANGLISAAYKIPNIVSTISGIFIQAWQISVVNEKMKSKNSHFYSTFYVHYNALLCIMSVLLIIFDKAIAKIVFGNDFYSAWMYVPFLVISSMLNSASGYMGAILVADMNSKALAKSATLGILTNVILNIVLTVLIGLQGITIATMIGSFIIYYERERQSKGEVRSNYYKYIMLSWILLVLMSISIIYFNDWHVGVVIAIVELIIYRDSIGVALKNIKVKLATKK